MASRKFEIKFPRPLDTLAQLTEALQQLGVSPHARIRITVNFHSQVTRITGVEPPPGGVLK